MYKDSHGIHTLIFILPHLAIQAILNGREAEILTGFEGDRFNWSLTLSSDRAGFTGLADRASVLGSRILSDK